MYRRSLAFSLLVVVVGCSGGSGGGGGSTGSGGNTGNGGSGGTAVDAGADAPADVELVEGGVADPGSVLCAGAPCSSADSYCCDDPDQQTETCVLKSVSACAGMRRECDEAVDCGTGLVCCIPPNQAIFIAYTTMCAPSCAADPLSYQVCKTNAECENGQACVTQPCHGEVISSCGPLPAERCQ